MTQKMEQCIAEPQNCTNSGHLSFMTPVGSFPGLIEKTADGYAIYIYGLPTHDAFQNVWRENSEIGGGWRKVTPNGRMRSIKEAGHRVEGSLRSAVELHDAYLVDHARKLDDELHRHSCLIQAHELTSNLYNLLGQDSDIAEDVAKAAAKIRRRITLRRDMLARRQSDYGSGQFLPSAAE